MPELKLQHLSPVHLGKWTAEVPLGKTLNLLHSGKLVPLLHSGKWKALLYSGMTALHSGRQPDLGAWPLLL